jgi:nickel-dependent lactate racemase
MLHKFPYKEFEPIEVPDEQLAGVYSINAAVTQKNPQQLIAETLENPIGSPRLKYRVHPGTKVLVVIDDNTRSTRTELMLPAIIAELLSAGLGKDDIKIFVALGTHRAMTRSEMELKYTPEIVAQYKFVLPNWREPSEYAVISAPGDFEIRIHNELLKADFIIGVGQTVPHLIAGFGGGCKIINPGCSDPDTIGRMHWLCNTVADGHLFAVRDNSVRKLIDEIGIKAGLKFIINEVPGKDDAISGVFAGDPILAHRKACDFAYSSCMVRISELTDIVLADAYPSDIDFWQALKGLHAACSAVRIGGTVILVTPCLEGVCTQHHEVISIGFTHSATYIQNLVSTGQLDPVPAAAIWLGSRMLERANIILVTKGISMAETAAMGFTYASDPVSALAQALKQHGTSAKINVLYKASKMICRVTGKTFSANSD